MPRLSGGEVLVLSLLDQGARTAFTLCGNHLLSAYDAAIGRDLRLIDVRHEAAAAHMADAWARVTGQPGVCIVTGGPGHTNAITGIATAYAADSPVIWISGGSEAEFRGKGAMQELDQVALARPITKWAAEVSDIRQIPWMISTAYRIARTGRPGPVHVTIPVDIMDATVELAEVVFPPALDWTEINRTGASPSLVERVATLLSQAERPAIVAGSGAWWSRSGEPLKAFVEETGVPVFTMDTARGIISDDHPLCFGYADPLLNPAARLLDQSDVVLILGRRLDYRLRYGQVFGSGAVLIQVDADPTEISRSRATMVGVQASPAAFLEQLRQKVGDLRWNRGDWPRELGRARAAAAAERGPAEASSERPIHPLRIVREIRDQLGNDYILTFDAGDFIQWARQALPARNPGSWLRLGAMATLGCAIPFAIGAKLARPSASVIALTGDGGVGFYGYELDTAVRHRVNFATVVANDAAWGMEKNLQTGIYGAKRVIASNLLPTRYDLIAEAMGASGEYVDSPDDLRSALERAIGAERPTLVNVQAACLPSSLTDASVKRKVARR